MKTPLLSHLTSIGNTGFQDFIVMSLTMLRLMVFEVMSFAIKISSLEQLISWFGGSSIMISLQEHFFMRETRSETSIGWGFQDDSWCNKR